VGGVRRKESELFSKRFPQRAGTDLGRQLANAIKTLGAVACSSPLPSLKPLGQDMQRISSEPTTVNLHIELLNPNRAVAGSAQEHARRRSVGAER
jgi:hypothetical protein